MKIMYCNELTEIQQWLDGHGMGATVSFNSTGNFIVTWFSDTARNIVTHCQPPLGSYYLGHRRQSYFSVHMVTLSDFWTLAPPEPMIKKPIWDWVRLD